MSLSIFCKPGRHDSTTDESIGINPLTLSIIGAGFGRTGTMSIKHALEHLGLGPCHHMEDVIHNPGQLATWQAAVHGEAIDWHAVLAGYKSSIDWPTTHYWHELIDTFSEARVLLSVRPVERWWQSFSRTIKQLLEMRNEIPDQHVREVLDMAFEMIATQTFSGDMSQANAVAVYQQRIDDVRQSVPTERLLVYDIAEGWQPLCSFLELPVPDRAFPHYNSMQEFWQTFGGGYQP